MLAQIGPWADTFYKCFLQEFNFQVTLYLLCGYMALNNTFFNNLFHHDGVIKSQWWNLENTKGIQKLKITHHPTRYRISTCWSYREKEATLSSLPFPIQCRGRYVRRRGWGAPSEAPRLMMITWDTQGGPSEDGELPWCCLWDPAALPRLPSSRLFYVQTHALSLNRITQHTRGKLFFT